MKVNKNTYLLFIFLCIAIGSNNAKLAGSQLQTLYPIGHDFNGKHRQEELSELDTLIAKLPEVQNDALCITMEICDECTHRVKYTLHNANLWSYETPPLVTYIDDVRVYNGKIILVTQVASDSKVIMIVDYETGQVIDTFLCMQPRISPSGRFILHLNHVPRFSSSELQSFQLLIYDIAKPPQENRLNKTTVIDKESLLKQAGLRLYASPADDGNDYHSYIEDRDLIMVNRFIGWDDNIDIGLAVFQSEALCECIIVNTITGEVRTKIYEVSELGEDIIGSDFSDFNIRGSAINIPLKDESTIKLPLEDYLP